MLKGLNSSAKFIRQLSVLPVPVSARSLRRRGIATRFQPDQSSTQPTPQSGSGSALASRNIVIAVGDAKEASSSAVDWAVGNLVRGGACGRPRHWPCKWVHHCTGYSQHFTNQLTHHSTPPPLPGDSLHLLHCVPSLGQGQLFSLPSGRLVTLPR